MKNFKIILLLGIGIALFTSCKKNVVAHFDYFLQNHTTWQDGEYVTDSVTIQTINNSMYASHCCWELQKNHGETAVYSNEWEPSFTCTESGYYCLRLTVFGHNGREATWSQSFQISVGADTTDTPVSLPSASFSLTINNGTYAPAVIQCHNTSTNATHYKWKLTYPNLTTTTSTTTNPSFNCTQVGSYTLQLIAYNANEQTSICTKSFSLASQPTSFTITWLQLEDIPMLASDNSSWDVGGGLSNGADPDIFFTITESGSSTTLYTSETKLNTAETDLPVSWTAMNVTLPFSDGYTIKFWDYDEIGDDLMASCSLNTSQIQPGTYSYTWSNTNIGVRFVIGLSWQ